ncbi:hypothetical protein FBU30_007975 [Linnemannia zychae]|nr:hypothetical protein FBU30_007975 [Linnemannia zychae]
MPFDMDAIDMSESEGEQDVAVDGFNGSIDGMDDDGSSSSGSDEEIEDRDNALSKDDGSFRSNKDSDVEHKNSFSVESPVSIYEPTPLASMLPSPVPSPRVMNHRAKVLRHDQQNENGDILRQLQEGKQCQPRPLQESILAQNQSLDIVDERESSKVSSQISDNYDNDVASLGSSVPSPVLTHSTPILSAQSTSPSSTSLSISPFPLESNMMLDSHLPKASSSIIDTPSIPSNLHSANIASNYHNIPLIPQDQEENSRLYTTVATNDDLFDEGMFEDEDSHSDQNNYNNSKVQEKDLQGTIEMETHSDLYGSLPQYTTHPTTATAATTVALVQQHQHRQEPDQTATASISDVVVAELKEVQSMLHDLHRRMDRLEQSLHDSQSTQNQTSPASMQSIPAYHDISGHISPLISRRVGRVDLQRPGNNVPGVESGFSNRNQSDSINDSNNSNSAVATQTAPNFTAHSTIGSTARGSFPLSNHSTTAAGTPIFNLNGVGTMPTTTCYGFARDTNSTGGTNNDNSITSANNTRNSNASSGVSAIPDSCDSNIVNSVASNKIRIPASAIRALTAPSSRPPTNNTNPEVLPSMGTSSNNHKPTTPTNYRDREGKMRFTCNTMVPTTGTGAGKRRKCNKHFYERAMHAMLVEIVRKRHHHNQQQQQHQGPLTVATSISTCPASTVTTIEMSDIEGGLHTDMSSASPELTPWEHPLLVPNGGNIF